MCRVVVRTQTPAGSLMLVCPLLSSLWTMSSSLCTVSSSSAGVRRGVQKPKATRRAMMPAQGEGKMPAQKAMVANTLKGVRARAAARAAYYKVNTVCTSAASLALAGLDREAALTVA